MPANNKFDGPLRASVVGGLLLCAALSSPALTMDRLRGTAWLGQPLDVTAQVRPEAGEDTAALCFEAEVFHGDQRQEASRVRLNTTVVSATGGLQVRVRSAVPVDEPVVTVYLRETCVSKSTRRYVLLSEIPTEAVVSPTTPVALSALAASAQPTEAVPAVASKPAVVAPLPPAAPATAKPPVQKPVQVRPEGVHKPLPRPVKPAAPVAAAQSAKDSKQPVVKPATKVTPPPPSTGAQAARPQLKLDPVDTLSERVALLETQRENDSGSVEQETQRLKKLEDSVQNLLKVASRNDRTIAELRERLQQAEADKYDNPVVYGLLALLLAALGGGVYLWRQQGRKPATLGLTQMPEEVAVAERRSKDTPWWRRADRAESESFGASRWFSFLGRKPRAADEPVLGAAAAAYPARSAVEPVVAEDPVATLATMDAPGVEADTLPVLANAQPALAETVPVATTAEVDLDDLLAADSGAESAGEFPSLASNDASSVSAPEVLSGGRLDEGMVDSAEMQPVNLLPDASQMVAVPEFPVPQVDIDVSHLSLSPVDDTPLPSLKTPAAIEALTELPALEFQLDAPVLKAEPAPAAANPAVDESAAPAGLDGDDVPMLDFDFTRSDDEAGKSGGGKPG